MKVVINKGIGGFGLSDKAFDYCWECSLGYDIDSIKGVPKENCPKSRTIYQLYALSKNYNKEKDGK